MAQFITISTSEGKDTHRVNIEHISYIKKLPDGIYAISLYNGEKIQTRDEIVLPMQKQIGDMVQ